MDASQIKQMGRRLQTFTRKFDDCFVRQDSREHLRTYINGQLSGLERKSIEPIALARGVPPRTLQAFLGLAVWDEALLRDRQQVLIAQEHAHPQAIGEVDDSGYPKKGDHTAGVQRQWCGNTGKKDNCVVMVHLGYTAGDFQCLLDSELYLPQDWAQDLERRARAGIPETMIYRKKTAIALAQIAHALGNGIRVCAWTFDSWYGRSGEFLDGLEALGQNYVGEVPCDFTGWLRSPAILVQPTAAQVRQRGRKMLFPRLARRNQPAGEVQNLVTYSPIFRKQKWQRFRVKEGEKGPLIWEAKFAAFYRRQGENGVPGRPHTLIVARNVLHPAEVKYFVSNLSLRNPGLTRENLLGIAFGRFGIERCFEIAKRDLGMDHFEVRSWKAIQRHFYISQLSQLFCARVHQDLREKNIGDAEIDGGTGAPGRRRLDPGPPVEPGGPDASLPGGGPTDRLLSTPQPAGPPKSSPNDLADPARLGNQNKLAEIVCTV